MNILLLIQNNAMKNAFNSLNTLSFLKSTDLSRKKLPFFALTDLKGKAFTSQKLDSELALLILFSPADCAVCLQEARKWQQIQQHFPIEKLKIIGIADNTTQSELQRFAHAMGLTFPILLDKKSYLKNELNIKESPVKILVDRKNEIIFIQKTSNSLDAQELSIHQLINIIKNRLSHSLESLIPEGGEKK